MSDREFGGECVCFSLLRGRVCIAVFDIVDFAGANFIEISWLLGGGVPRRC
jgi:hypothetical protein